jgi:ABC-type multidrug transport system permease subunit
LNKSLRWKMILYFIASIFLAAAGVLVLLLMALFLATVSGFFSGALNFLELSLGEIPVMILTGCINISSQVQGISL